jgi:hypothetical protein
VEEREGNGVKHQQNYERFTDNYRLSTKPKDTSQSEAQKSAYAKKKLTKNGVYCRTLKLVLPKTLT